MKSTKAKEEEEQEKEEDEEEGEEVFAISFCSIVPFFKDIQCTIVVYCIDYWLVVDAHMFIHFTLHLISRMYYNITPNTYSSYFFIKVATLIAHLY